jgi:hypothetical protein
MRFRFRLPVPLPTPSPPRHTLCELQQRRVAAHLFSTFALARAALRASPRKARGGSHTAALGPTASSFVATRSSSSAS